MTEEFRSPPEKVHAAIAALWEKFSENLFGRLALLERASRAVKEACLSEELRQDAAMAAHQLAGSLGTFSFPEGSKLAREIELILQPDNPQNQARSDRLSELVGSLRREMEWCPS